jgi:hydrogenase maturation protein HypF
MARTIAAPNREQEEALLSSKRPNVLVPKKRISEEITELDTVGIMLPYSALHFLLFTYYDAPMIFTSSNESDEPITTHREEQKTEYVLDHSRQITNAADDSIVKIIAGKTFFIRRSRGYAPTSLSIPKSGQTILALGAEMNNTFCIGRPEGRAILSQHMGNTANFYSFDRYKKSIDAFLRFTGSDPDLFVADLHPGYNTASYAAFLSEEYSVPLIKVQHHRAHARGTALEHGLSDFAAIVADGLGYGEDGSIWGGEIFDGDARVGHLEQQLQVGGDSATHYPAKMLFSILRNFLSLGETKACMSDAFSSEDFSLLDAQRRERFNAPLSSSCGRVLDAASFLLGFCTERTYDGSPAMLLEANSSFPFTVSPVVENNILMTTPLFEFLVQNLDKDKKRLAATVQYYLAEGFYSIARQYKKPIVFSGGCAYNRIMSEYLIKQGVLTNTFVPAGDGGISFGQIAYSLVHS